MPHPFALVARAARALRHALPTTMAPGRLLLPLGVLATTAQAQTTTYTYTGGPQTYVVPVGITTVQVVATGGTGGTRGSSTTALRQGHRHGAVVQATLTVVPGEVLTVVVGGNGSNGGTALGPGFGGYNGGGTGHQCGGGGGATDVRRASAAGSTGDYLATRNALVVAGGSGGCGGAYGIPLIEAFGGAGGVPNGGDGLGGSGSGSPGLGATQAAPGSGSVSGSNATGGAGQQYTLYSGGGGGGYYGGGGANAPNGNRGGGGGSSWVTPTGSRDISYSLAPAPGNGSLTITPITPVATYAYTGGPQTYTVPAGVTAVRVTATGASGSMGGGSAAPAKGAVVQANLLVTPGEVLTLRVGGQGGSGSGTTPGGYNGGGTGFEAGAGGGATDVRRASAAGSTGDYLATRNALLVAGGGGGGDYAAATVGGTGGVPTGANGLGSGTPGRGATPSGPGGGGTSGSGPTGGAGSAASYYNGGGGGGYYGGGGADSGGSGAGGGGGSSWVMPTGSAGISYGLAPAPGAGSVTILPLTVSYAYTGGPQTYVVPAGVRAVRVVATGAGGGAYSGETNYSSGAQVQTTLLVTPGEVLTVQVGGQGGSSGSPGGYNGGGGGYNGGGGGGASDVRRAAGSTSDYLTTRNALVVAGGGGGSALPPITGGGNGGTPTGGDGVNNSGFYASAVGGGASQSGPGSGGRTGSNVGSPGSGDTGGTGGAGGGGGYYGGGAAASVGAGGGGGSSWVTPTGSRDISYGLAPAPGHGAVSITPLPLPDLVVSTAGQSVPAGLYNSITVQSGGVATLAASPYVFGNTTVQSGGVLNDNCEVLTGAGSFTLAAGGTLGICNKFGISTTGSTGSIQVEGIRSFSPDASYLYTDGAQQTGTGLPATVRALALTNGAELTLTNSVTATATATFSRGVLVTGANTLTLGPTATLTEDAEGYVTGTVQTTRPLATAGAPETFGGLGLSLTPSGTTLPGSTLVRRVTGTAVSGQGASQSVKRYFDVEPTVRTGLDVALALTVRDDERNSISANRLRLFRSQDAGASWQPLPATVSATAASGNQPATYTARLAGISSFSRWTLGDERTPLPVELTQFTATPAGPQAVRLAWATASETHSAHFEVQRSPDGAAWTTLGTVAAAGSSTSPRNYAYLDAAAPTGISYYRLRQVDLDGTFAYSPVRAVTLGATGLALYPSPTQNRATTLTGTTPGQPVQVLDALGRPVLATTADAAGTAQLVLPVGLPAGVYLVRAGGQALRLVIE